MYFDVTLIFGRNIGDKKAFIDKVKAVMDTLDDAFYVDTLDNGLSYRYGYNLDDLATKTQGRCVVAHMQPGDKFDVLNTLLKDNFDVFIDITHPTTGKRDIILAAKPVRTKSFAEIDRENEQSMWE